MTKETMAKDELNPELEMAILRLLPGCDRGLIRSTLRIYFMREQLRHSPEKTGSVIILDVSPEGRVGEWPRWFARKVG